MTTPVSGIPAHRAFWPSGISPKPKTRVQIVKPRHRIVQLAGEIATECDLLRGWAGTDGAEGDSRALRFLARRLRRLSGNLLRLSTRLETPTGSRVRRPERNQCARKGKDNE